MRSSGERRGQVDADKDSRRRTRCRRWHDPVSGSPLDPTAARRRISFVHQDLGLIESMSVGENMAWVTAIRAAGSSSTGDRPGAAAKALEFLDSPLPLDRPVSELSRAEKSSSPSPAP